MSIQALYVLIVLFILPESLSPEARQQLAEAAAAERKRRTARDAAEVAWQQGSASVAHDSVRRRIGRKIVLTARHIIGKVVAPFEPLRVVLPTLKDPEHPQLGRNWNFTLLIIVRLFFTLTYVSCRRKQADDRVCVSQKSNMPSSRSAGHKRSLVRSLVSWRQLKRLCSCFSSLVSIQLNFL